MQYGETDNPRASGALVQEGVFPGILFFMIQMMPGTMQGYYGIHRTVDTLSGLSPPSKGHLTTTN